MSDMNISESELVAMTTTRDLRRLESQGRIQ